jgi:hypothetical protein
VLYGRLFGAEAPAMLQWLVDTEEAVKARNRLAAGTGWAPPGGSATTKRLCEGYRCGSSCQSLGRVASALPGALRED